MAVSAIFQTEKYSYLRIMSDSVRNVGAMVHDWNPSTHKTEAGGSQVPGQPGQHENNVSQKN